MDDRHYRFFINFDWWHKHGSGEASVRAFGKLMKFRKAEVDDLLAQYREHKANPSPMVHMTTRELEALLEGPRYPLRAPDGFQRSQDAV